MNHEHCPHQTGRVKPMNPPIKVVVCCYCGVEGWSYAELVKTNHGPYAPPSYEYGSKITWHTFQANR
jgi:hypothetical protein